MSLGFKRLTLVLVGGGWFSLCFDPFNPGMTQYPLYRRLDGPQGHTGLLRKVLPPTGIRFLDHPACSESLHLLCYPSPPWVRFVTSWGSEILTAVLEGIRSSGMWHCVIGWVYHDVLNMCSAFETSGTADPVTQGHIPVDSEYQFWCMFDCCIAIYLDYTRAEVHDEMHHYGTDYHVW